MDKTSIEEKLTLIRSQIINKQKERTNLNSESDMLTSEIDLLEEEETKLEGELTDIECAEDEEGADLTEFSEEHDDTNDAYQLGN